MCPCLPGIGSQHEHRETQLQSCTLRPTAPPPTPSGFTSASTAPQSAPAASRAPSNARQVARRSSSAAPARRSAAHPPRGALLRHRGRLSSSHPCRPTYLDCPPAAACQSADAQGPGLLHRQGPMHLHMQSWTVSMGACSNTQRPCHARLSIRHIQCLASCSGKCRQARPCHRAGRRRTRALRRPQRRRARQARARR